jgi:hypothetical protein
MINNQCVSHICTRKNPSVDSCDLSIGCMLDSNSQCIRDPCFTTSEPTSIVDCPGECGFSSGSMNLLY